MWHIVSSFATWNPAVLNKILLNAVPAINKNGLESAQYILYFVTKKPLNYFILIIRLLYDDFYLSFFLLIYSVGFPPPSRILNNLLLLIKHIILQRKPQTSKNFSRRPQFLPSSWSNPNMTNFELQRHSGENSRKFPNFHSDRPSIVCAEP